MCKIILTQVILLFYFNWGKEEIIVLKDRGFR